MFAYLQRRCDCLDRRVWRSRSSPELFSASVSRAELVDPMWLSGRMEWAVGLVLILSCQLCCYGPLVVKSSSKQTAARCKDKWYIWERGRLTPIGSVSDLLAYKKHCQGNFSEFEVLQRSVDDSGKDVMTVGKRGSWWALGKAVESD